MPNFDLFSGITGRGQGVSNHMRLVSLQTIYYLLEIRQTCTCWQNKSLILKYSLDNYKYSLYTSNSTISLTIRKPNYYVELTDEIFTYMQTYIGTFSAIFFDTICRANSNDAGLQKNVLSLNNNNFNWFRASSININYVASNTRCYDRVELVDNRFCLYDAHVYGWIRKNCFRFSRDFRKGGYSSFTPPPPPLLVQIRPRRGRGGGARISRGEATGPVARVLLPSFVAARLKQKGERRQVGQTV